MVLPGFLLRAFIPLGFMPMFGPGHSVQLTLCEGYAPVASVDMPMDMSMDMPMDMPSDMGTVMPASGAKPHGSNHGSTHAACPYGASPTLATLALSGHLDVAEQPASTAVLSAPQIDHAEIAPRAQSPRGPPQDV
jgi:hypothetical protein